MPTRLSITAFTLISGLLILSGAVLAQQNSAIYMAENSPLDNTRQNVRDKDNTTLTPQNQKQDKTDIKITSHIRKAVHKDKSLDGKGYKLLYRIACNVFCDPDGSWNSPRKKIIVIEIDKSTNQKPNFELELRHLHNFINILVL